MSTKTTLTSFVKEVIALVQGDQASATAAKNQRKLASGLQAQIHSLNSKVVDAEIKIEEAQEELNLAKKCLVRNSDGNVTQCALGSMSSHLHVVDSCQEKLEAAEEELADLKSTIEARKAYLKEVE